MGSKQAFEAYYVLCCVRFLNGTSMCALGVLHMEMPLQLVGVLPSMKG